MLNGQKDNRWCVHTEELGYEPHAGKAGHAGRTFKLLYKSPITNSSEFIKIDLDYVNRVPLLKPLAASSKLGKPITKFPINAPVEVVAGKLKAICERVTPRDLYDLGRIAKTQLSWSTGDETLDHAIMIYYLSLSTSFPKEQDILERFDGREKEIESILWPVLPAETRPTLENLKDSARPFIEWATKPVSKEEAKYLSQLSRGKYEPELLFSFNEEMLLRAKSAPAMQWKLHNLYIGIEKGLVHPIVEQALLPD